MNKKPIVYDTSAILNAFYFDDINEFYCPNAIVNEIKDLAHKKIFENLIKQNKVRFYDPKEKVLNYVFKKTNKSKLSRVDKIVLATALDLNAILITDDLELTNFATKLGLLVEQVNNKPFKVEFLDKIYDEFKPLNLDDVKRQANKIVKLLSEKKTSEIKEIVFAGSSARGTYVKEAKDLDIFILFDLKVPEEELSERLKVLLDMVFPGLELKTEYSQHPYFKAKLFGYDVEFVPGYKITDIKERKSAVDRTPLHMQYLNKRLNDFYRKEIILFKVFLKNNLLYGADLKYDGFPGYLVELFILHYGSFLNTIKAIANWNNRVDINYFYETVDFKDPLVFVDPVDPERNVASAFSKENFEILKYLAKKFVKNPSDDFFKGNVFGKVDLNQYLIFSCKFDLDNEFAIWGKAKALAKKAKKYLKQKHVNLEFNYAIYYKNKVYFLFKFSKNDVLHKGPLVSDKKNAEIFKQKWKNVFVKDSRLFAKIKFNEDIALQELINFLKENCQDLKKDVLIYNEEIEKFIAKRKVYLEIVNKVLNND